MKRIISFLVILLFSFSVSAQYVEVSRHMSGSWFNPEQEGHGISLEILDDGVAVFYWYIYNPDGTPTFLIALGRVDGNNIFATAYHQTGMRWGTFLASDVFQQEWGTISLDFADCNNMNVNYSSTHSEDGIPSGDGIIPMTRLANIDQTQCHPVRAANIYRGYLETDDGDDESFGATFLMAGDGKFVAWVDDYFAAFGGFGQGEAEEGEFYLHHDYNNVLYDFSDGVVRPPVAVAAQGVLAPEYRILVDRWQAGQGPLYRGDMYAVDYLYRRGLDFTQWMGLSEAEELITGESGYIDVWTSGGQLNMHGNLGEGGGCMVNGYLRPQDPLFNMMDAELTLLGCDDRDGTFRGLAAQTDNNQFDDGLQLAVFAHSGDHALALIIDRF